VSSGLRRVITQKSADLSAQYVSTINCAAVHSELDLPSTGRASFDKSHLYLHLNWSHLYRYTVPSRVHWMFIQWKWTFLL